jgi:hypothetical protein
MSLLGLEITNLTFPVDSFNPHRFCFAFYFFSFWRFDNNFFNRYCNINIRRDREFEKLVMC